MIKRLLGIFDAKKLTPEQIYERTMIVIKKNEQEELLKMAKIRGEIKIKKQD